MAAVGVGALVLTGAAAFTNSLAFSNTNTTVAYGQEVVSGATVTNISYGLNSTGDTVNSVTFQTSVDTSGSAAENPNPLPRWPWSTTPRGPAT